MKRKIRWSYVPVKIATTIGVIQAIANLLMLVALLHQSQKCGKPTGSGPHASALDFKIYENHQHLHLAIVIPYVDSELDHLVSRIEAWHQIGNACSQPSRGHRAGLFFYNDLFQKPGTSFLEERIQILKTSLPSTHVLGCFAELRTIYAELKPEENGYPEGPSMMFFNLMLQERLRDDALAGYTHVMWMEWDAKPISPLWMDALIRDVTDLGNDNFWVRGSHYLGKGLDFLTEKTEHRGWLGHINGNAIYNLRDPEFHTFLRLVVEREPPTDYWRPFDIAMWRVLHDFPYSWRFYQAYRHKFQYTSVIRSIEEGAPARYYSTATGCYIVHQSRPLLQNTRYNQKYDSHGVPRANRTMYGYELRPNARLSVLVAVAAMGELQTAVLQLRLARRFIPYALEYVLTLSSNLQVNAKEIPSFVRVVFINSLVLEPQRLQKAFMLLKADTFCIGAHVLYLEEEIAIVRLVYHKDLFLLNKPIVEISQTPAANPAVRRIDYTRIDQNGSIIHGSPRHVYPLHMFVKARDYLCLRVNASSLEAAMHNVEDTKTGARFSATDFLVSFLHTHVPDHVSLIRVGANKQNGADITPYSELNVPSPFCKLSRIYAVLDQLPPQARIKEAYKILQKIERQEIISCA